MGDSVHDEPSRQQSGPVSPRDGPGHSVRPFYITFMQILSVIWVGALVLYVLRAPSLFMRMWPNEVGDLLSGWFAPLAMAWVAVAAFLQRDQLASEREELRQTSEALQLQAEELRRSMEEIERQTEHRNSESARRDRERAAALMDRLYERLMFGIERVARIGEGCILHSPSDEAGDIDLVEVLGEWRKYADWSKSDEVARSVNGLGKGLDSLIDLLRDGWRLDISLTGFNDLCTEFHYLERIALEVERVAPTVGDQQPTLGLIEEFDTRAFRDRVKTACDELEAMERELQNLDFPDTSS